MASYIKILQIQLQSSEFFEILDRIFHPIDQDEKQQIVRQILELVAQDSRIRESADSLNNGDNTEALESFIRMTIERIKQSLTEASDVEIEDEDQLLDGAHNEPYEPENLLSDDAIADAELYMFLEDEYNQEEQQPMTIEEVWAKMAFEAFECKKTFSPGAA